MSTLNGLTPPNWITESNDDLTPNLCGPLTSFFFAFTHTVPQSFNICLKNDGHITTLVFEIHGLFELLFLLTTNKYLCQCLCISACLSAVPNGFLICIADICHSPKTSCMTGLVFFFYYYWLQ